MCIYVCIRHVRLLKIHVFKNRRAYKRGGQGSFKFNKIITSLSVKKRFQIKILIIQMQTINKMNKFKIAFRVLKDIQLLKLSISTSYLSFTFMIFFV